MDAALFAGFEEKEDGRGCKRRMTGMLGGEAGADGADGGWLVWRDGGVFDKILIFC